MFFVNRTHHTQTYFHQIFVRRWIGDDREQQLDQIGIDERPNIFLRSFRQRTCVPKRKSCKKNSISIAVKIKKHVFVYREQLPHHSECISVHFPEIKWSWDVGQHLVKWPCVSVYHCQWPHSLDKSTTLGFCCYRHGCTNRRCRIVNFQHPKNKIENLRQIVVSIVRLMQWNKSPIHRTQLTRRTLFSLRKK